MQLEESEEDLLEKAREEENAYNWLNLNLKNQKLLLLLSE